MAIIVEDGTIVANANSYITTDEYEAYLESLGVSITDFDAAEVQMIKAAQFIDSHEANLKGSLTDRDQAMAYPRHDLFIDGWSWASDEIPRQVILAQLSIANDIRGGEDPYNPTVNKVTTEERVEGAVTVKYASGKPSKISKQSTSNAVMNSLLRSSGMFSVPSVRA